MISCVILNGCVELTIVTSANEGAKTTGIDCYRRRFYSEERREKRQDLLGERIHISAYNAGLGQSARDGYHHVPGAVFGYGSLYVVTGGRPIMMVMGLSERNCRAVS